MGFPFISLCLAASLPVPTATLPQVGSPSVVGLGGASSDEKPYVHDYEFVPEGEADPASVPAEDGIAWYGTWEDAMAEKERTGKPVMLHMGSPRCPAKSGYRVPGTW